MPSSIIMIKFMHHFAEVSNIPVFIVIITISLWICNLLNWHLQKPAHRTHYKRLISTLINHKEKKEVDRITGHHGIVATVYYHSNAHSRLWTCKI